MLRSFWVLVLFSFWSRCSLSRSFVLPTLHIERAASLIRRPVAHPGRSCERRPEIYESLVRRKRKRKIKSKNQWFFRAVVRRDVTIHGKSFNLRASRMFGSASGIILASVWRIVRLNFSNDVWKVTKIICGVGGGGGATISIKIYSVE